MITPEIFIDSIKSFRAGEKKFCKLATISSKENDAIIYFGFWIEVIRNDHELVLSIKHESFLRSEPAQTVVFFGKEHLETFIEYARQDTSIELGKLFCPEQS
jgi:hypothetical protein